MTIHTILDPQASINSGNTMGEGEEIQDTVFCDMIPRTAEFLKFGTPDSSAFEEIRPNTKVASVTSGTHTDSVALSWTIWTLTDPSKYYDFKRLDDE